MQLGSLGGGWPSQHQDDVILVLEVDIQSAYWNYEIFWYFLTKNWRWRKIWEWSFCHISKSCTLVSISLSHIVCSYVLKQIVAKADISIPDRFGIPHWNPAQHREENAAQLCLSFVWHTHQIQRGRIFSKWASSQPPQVPCPQDEISGKYSVFIMLKHHLVMSLSKWHQVKNRFTILSYLIIFPWLLQDQEMVFSIHSSPLISFHAFFIKGEHHLAHFSGADQTLGKSREFGSNMVNNYIICANPDRVESLYPTRKSEHSLCFLHLSLHVWDILLTTHVGKEAIYLFSIDAPIINQLAMSELKQ